AAMRDREDEAKTLEKYKSKSLVIAGKEDKNVPESVSLKMGSIIGGNKCFIFERTAHMAMYESKLEAISTIKKFAGSMTGFGNR
ncbi:MAG TPA: hypothetical protein VGA29_02115, partial [Ignavibacteriaceae bacterium]